MIAAERIAAVLLAAGSSSRFGAQDKLTAPFKRFPLGLHAARTLSVFPFAAKIAITRVESVDFSSTGFDMIRNLNPERGMSSSIQLGVIEASRRGAEAVLIALADMPSVALAHYSALMDAVDDDNPIVGSMDGVTAGPPAIFAASKFALFTTLSGDRGARAYLRNVRLVRAKRATLVDIDEPSDLTALA